MAIENVGMGPALNVRGLAEVGAGGTVRGQGRTVHPVEGVAAGVSNAVEFSVDFARLRLEAELWARLAYEDVAGRTYWTDFHYNVDSKAYRVQVLSDAAEPPSNLPTERLVHDVFA